MSSKKKAPASKAAPGSAAPDGEPSRAVAPPAPSQLSHANWHSLIRHAWAGRPRYLLEALLGPLQTDGAGRPTVWAHLPEDADLRQRIVHVLMLGPWAGAAKFPEPLAALQTRTGWGRKKTRLLDVEVQVADMLVQGEPLDRRRDELDSQASALGTTPEALSKRIGEQKRMRRNAARKKPG